MAGKKKKKRSPLRTLYTFAITWAILSWIIPVYRFPQVFLLLSLCSLSAYLGHSGYVESQEEEQRSQSKTAKKKTGATKSNSATPKKTQGAKQSQVVKQEAAKPAAPKKSYGPKVDPILEEGNKALSEMGRLYMSIQDQEVRGKINEIMRITDKIVQDAIADPTDIPQIKKFMSYYLPTTIKLLNAYDRMSSQGIEGENLDKSMRDINEMLDAAIVAYKRRLDSLFANQALDIQTEIDVMNTMLAREGLLDNEDFIMPEEQEPGEGQLSQGV